MIIVVSVLKEACTGMERFLEKQVGTAQIGRGSTKCQP